MVHRAESALFALRLLLSLYLLLLHLLLQVSKFCRWFSCGLLSAVVGHVIISLIQFYRCQIAEDRISDGKRTVMTKTTTYTLYVNLSASQTRKRLKGHGFGVKKVEAADRNQAVIIHTATREHLSDLEALFADVMSSESGEGLRHPY